MKSIKHISNGQNGTLTGTVWYTTEDNKHYHRTNGPAVIQPNNKYRAWFVNGRYHRKSGPARISAEEEAWFQNDNLHRTNGPALIYSNGEKYWYLFGKHITQTTELSNKQKWLFLKSDIESVKVIANLTKEMQEFVCQQRPDLISQISNLHLKLRKKHEHEINLSKIDI